MSLYVSFVFGKKKGQNSEKRKRKKERMKENGEEIVLLVALVAKELEDKSS